jgi:hypothetical protein
MCARSGSLSVRFFPFSEAERHCSGNPDWNEASALDYVRLIVLSTLCVCAVESTSESNSHLCPTAAIVEIGPLIYSGRAVGMREREREST